jgi:hypothetical protein
VRSRRRADRWRFSFGSRPSRLATPVRRLRNNGLVRPFFVALTVLMSLTGCSLGLHPEITVNEDALGQVRQRLDVAVDDLNAIKDPAFAHASRPATLSGCTTDSGDLFQPEVFQSWRLVGSAKTRNLYKTTRRGRAAALDIARQLIALGWSGSPKLDKYAAVSLWQSVNGHKVGLTVQALNNELIASAGTTPKHVCRKA